MTPRTAVTPAGPDRPELPQFGNAGGPSPVAEVGDERLARLGVRLWLKRDDLVHPEIPGNKWRKLRLNLAAAARAGDRTLLTFGGAYSGHLRATAAAGRLFGFATIGVVRGEEHDPLNPVLRSAADAGMRLVYLDRATYRRKGDPDVVAALHDRFGEFRLLPEGGSNALAVRGCTDVTDEINAQVPVDVICTAVGTGGTLAGIAGALTAGQRALGVAVLKGGSFLTHDTERLQTEAFGGRRGDWAIETGYHHGGYAKTTPALEAFAADFTRRHGIALDRIYVAKLLAAIYDLAAQGRFAPGTRIAAVITGPPSRSDPAEPLGQAAGERRGGQDDPEDHDGQDDGVRRDGPGEHLPAADRPVHLPVPPVPERARRRAERDQDQPDHRPRADLRGELEHPHAGRLERERGPDPREQGALVGQQGPRVGRLICHVGHHPLLPPHDPGNGCSVFPSCPLPEVV
ncbi:MAG: 1-aminocyclopropane-carboxylate deaminase [Cryptosporangiaceae bacterium]|nr:1-aminocyclopropane-carboxylate deaminase [Cryptosporangiaceae bacterium]